MLEPRTDAPGVYAASYDELTVNLDYYGSLRSAHWLKLFLLRTLVDHPGHCFEYLVVVDDDVMVTNFTVDLADVLGTRLPSDSIGAAADASYAHHAQSDVAKGYVFNTGVLAVRLDQKLADVPTFREESLLPVGSRTLPSRRTRRPPSDASRDSEATVLVTVGSRRPAGAFDPGRGVARPVPGRAVSAAELLRLGPGVALGAPRPPAGRGRRRVRAARAGS